MIRKRWTALGAAALSILMLPTARAQSDQDKTFLGRASQSDFNEIKLSQLAADKATEPNVKQFASRMVTDHTNLEQQMAPFAQQWGVQPANSLDSEHQALYDKLSGLSGKDFDKEYMRAMDKDHHLALTDFQAERQTAKDATFKQAVSQGEKVVSEHTKMADRIANKLGVASPEAANGSNQPM